MVNVGFSIYNRLGVVAFPLSGYCFPFDTFTYIADFSTTGNIISNKKVIWNFGDGTTSANLTGRHFYSYPGLYPVTLTVFDSGGNGTTSTIMSAVKIFNAVEDVILITNNGNLVQKSGQANNPIFVTRYNSIKTSVSGANTILTLAVSGHNSPFYDAQVYDSDKYAHLKPSAKFAVNTNLGYTVVDSVTTTNVFLYASPSNSDTSLSLGSSAFNNTYLVGSSGTATFYYVEDFSS